MLALFSPSWLLSSVVCSFLLPLTWWSEGLCRGQGCYERTQISESGGENPGRVIRPETSELEIKLFVCVCVCVRICKFTWILKFKYKPAARTNTEIISEKTDLLTQSFRTCVQQNR